MNRYVVGSYTSPQEAIEAVRKLQEEGYRKEAITLVSSTESKNSISTTTNVEVSTDEAVTNQKTNAKRSDDRSAWEKIKGVFSTEDHDGKVSTNSDDDPLYSYQQDLANGNIIVMINEEKKGRNENESHEKGKTTTPLDPDPMFGAGPGITLESSSNPDEPTNASNSDYSDQKQRATDETIQLKEEQLDVTKQEVQTGEVQAKKRVIEETKTIEVPVRHEEIVIEQHNLDGTNDSNSIEKEKKIVIPVSEEQIEVTKRPTVKEEVSIHKQSVEDTKQVKGTVKKEELNVETEGHAHINEINDSNQ